MKKSRVFPPLWTPLTLWGLFLSGCHTPPSPPAPHPSPWTPRLVESVMGPYPKAKPCPSSSDLPPFPNPLEPNKFYADTPENDTVDPERMAAYQATMAPVQAWMGQITEWGRRLTWAQRLSLPKARHDAAECLFGLLRNLHHQKAFEAEPHHNQGRYVISWNTTVLGLQLQRLEDEGLPASSLDTLGAWIASLARRTQRYAEPFSGKPWENNHRDWAALAVLVGAHWEKDPKIKKDMEEWSILSYKKAVMKIAPNGTLPEENARGEKALSYNNFALTPLALMLGLVHRDQGWDAAQQLLRHNDGALLRLAAFCRQGMLEPSRVEGVFPKAQHPLPPKGNAAWSEILMTLNPDPLWQSLRDSARPYHVGHAGGEVTLTWGTP